MKAINMKYSLLFCCVFLLVSLADAQTFFSGRAVHAPVKVKLLQGTPAVLEGRSLHVSFMADSAVNAGHGSLDKFIGTGYQQLFIRKFNTMAAKHRIVIQADSTGASYRLTITTIRLHIGSADMVYRDDALIDAVCDFRDDQGRTVALFFLQNIPGDAFGPKDYDTPARISQCYQKLAKVLYNRIQPYLPGSQSTSADEM
ncbi:MAG: hypothetical protein JST76_01730 [Bacteroidetes bacterium]|nr:hypothetical protein [Bacteroidota bacterium]